MSKVIVIVLLGLTCLVGVTLSAVRLPGIWLIAGISFLISWLTHWQLISGAALLWIVGLGLLAEALEFAMSSLITRKAGGSSRAAWGALLGGFIGLLFFSIPLPIIGSAIGALLGCFLGAAIGELSIRGTLMDGTRVGVSAAIGFALGAALKVALAFVISIIVVVSALRSSWIPGGAVPAITSY